MWLFPLWAKLNSAIRTDFDVCSYYYFSRMWEMTHIPGTSQPIAAEFIFLPPVITGRNKRKILTHTIGNEPIALKAFIQSSHWPPPLKGKAIKSGIWPRVWRERRIANRHLKYMRVVCFFAILWSVWGYLTLQIHFQFPKM